MKIETKVNASKTSMFLMGVLIFVIMPLIAYGMHKGRLVAQERVHYVANECDSKNGDILVVGVGRSSSKYVCIGSGGLIALSKTVVTGYGGLSHEPTH